MIKNLTFALFFLITYTLSNAQVRSHIAPINPDFIDYLKSNHVRLKSADSLPKAFGYIPPYTVLPEISLWKNAQESSLRAAVIDTLPKIYDLRTLKKVTSVKYQGSGSNGGNCWAFSTMGAIESNWLVRGYSSADLSEQNLVTCHNFLWGFGEGGNEYLAQGYLTRLKGPVSESSVPYNTTDSSTFNCATAQAVAYVPETRWVYNNIAYIKRVIIDYGAVSTNMFWDDAFYTGSPNYTYCYTGKQKPNHAVAVVGWDDTKVIPQVSGIGAWIAKNQWGTSWADKGYFYISYHDKKTIQPIEYYPVRWPVTYIDTLYKWEKAGVVTYMGFNSETACALAKFHANKKQYIRKIGTFLNHTGATVKIDIYSKKDSDTLSNLLASVSPRVVNSPGFYTFDIPVLVDSDFYVKITYNSPGFNYPIPIEIKVDGYVNPVIEPWGKQWVSKDGTKWQYFKDSSNWDANLVIHAYGISSLNEIADFEPSKSEICGGDSVVFTNKSAGSIGNYTWRFGADATPSTATGSGPFVVTYSSQAKTGFRHVTLKVTGTDNSTDSIVKDIKIVKQLTTFISLPSYILVGDTAKLVAVGDGESFSWFPSSYLNSDTGKQALFTSKTPGMYKYTVTMMQGHCSGSATYNIEVLKPPVNDNMCDAIELHVGDNGPFTNDNATVQFNEPYPTDTCCNCAMTWCDEGGLQHSVWFKFTAPASGQASFDTRSVTEHGKDTLDLDTQIAIYSSNSCDSIKKADLVAANDDYYQFAPYSAAINNVKLTPGKNYWIQVDGSAGGDTGTFYIHVYDGSIGIKKVAQPNERLTVYPNPNNGSFDVVYKSDEAEPFEIAVYDLMGKLQYTSTYKKDAGEKMVSVNLLTFAKGMYFVNVKGSKNNASAKFIIK